MLSLTTISIFVLASFLLAIAPGSNLIYITTRSVAQGRHAGILSALGATTGNLVHTFANALGLSALMATSAIAFSVVKYVGVAYLIYIGVQTLLSKVGMIQVKSKEQVQLREVFCQGLLVSLLNPQTILFLLAFLPQFVDSSRGSIALQLFLLGVVLMVVKFSVYISVGLASGQFGAWLRARRGVQQATKWLTGSIYIALGVTTAG